MICYTAGTNIWPFLALFFWSLGSNALPATSGTAGWNSTLSAHGGAAGTASPTSRSLPPCDTASPTTSSTSTGPTSWKTGACTPTIFDTPSTTLKCASTTISPLHVSGCACPKGNIYEGLSGGDPASGPCGSYIGTPQSDLLLALINECPAVSSASPSNCVIPTTSAAPVSSTPLDSGEFSVSPTYPKTCSASTIGFSSTKAMQTGYIFIDPGTSWGKVGSVWTFKTGGGVKIDNLNNTSNPGTSSFGGNPEPAADNYTRKADGSWTMTVIPNMPDTIGLVALTSGNLSNNSFPFTITSTVPCDVPVAQACNVSDHNLNPDQWKAFRTDDFVAQAMTNWTQSKTPQFWPWFVNEYVGEGFVLPALSIKILVRCGPLTQSCADMKNTPFSRQAYLTMSAMMTLSRYLHFVYSAYGQADTDLGNVLPNWETYFNLLSKTIGWEQSIAVGASIVGMLSVIGFAVAPFTGGASLAIGAVGSGLFGLNSIMNSAINFANAHGAAAMAELQFDDYAHALNAMNNYINVSQQALVDTHNDMFIKGTNITQILQNGALVGDNMIKQTTDSSVSVFVTSAASWFDKLAVLELINQAWKKNDNYIVFVPYGPIGWYGGAARNFQQADCESQFLGNGKWAGTIYASCTVGPAGNPGMAMFMVPQNSGQVNEYNKRDFYDVKNYQIENYTFNADDVLKSSLACYFQYGYDYNATQVNLGSVISSGNTDPLQKIADLQPADPGVFNLPVCRIYDLKYVPACTITSWSGSLDPCYSQPASCLQANWTSPGGDEVQKFTDHVSQNLIDGLNSATCYDFGC